MSSARLAELKCPRCKRTHWEIWYPTGGLIWANSNISQRESEPEVCPLRSARVDKFEILRKSPQGFLLPAHAVPPPCIISREVYDYWNEILTDSGLDKRDGEIVYIGSQPLDIPQKIIIEYMLFALSFLSKLKNKPRAILGEDLNRLDRFAVSLLLEFYLRTELELDSGETLRRLEQYYELEQSVRILTTETLEILLPGLWGYFIREFEKLVEPIRDYHDLVSNHVFQYDSHTGSAIRNLTNIYLRESLPAEFPGIEWKYMTVSAPDHEIPFRSHPPLQKFLPNNYEFMS